MIRNIRLSDDIKHMEICPYVIGCSAHVKISFSGAPNMIQHNHKGSGIVVLTSWQWDFISCRSLIDDCYLFVTICYHQYLPERHADIISVQLKIVFSFNFFH